MIPRLLWSALLWLARLIIPARAQRTRIDTSAPCPACGYAKFGSIKTIRQGPKLFIQHSCMVCTADWHEELIGDQNAIVIKAAGEP